MADQRYNNENSGVLFINKQQQGSKRPSVNGKVNISKAVLKELVDMMSKGETPYIDIAGWEKVSKTGNPFISIVCKPPSEAKKWEKKSSQSSSSQSQSSDFDDIPF